MTLKEFLSLGETHEISFPEAQKLNGALSKASVADIPEHQRHLVLDYLVCALNMGSVDPRILPKVEALRISLEESTMS
jgi:hypothetical protein